MNGMIWTNKILDEVSKKCNDGVVNIEAGFGPTGLPHIGTLCEILRTNIVKEKLDAAGFEVNYFLISDDLDPFRKIPLNIPGRESLVSFLGKPVCQVPDPYNTEASFSAMAEKRLMELAEEFGISCKLVRSSQAYNEGFYNRTLQIFLENYHAINDICCHSIGILRQRTYSMFMPISPSTGKVLEHIKITKLNFSQGEITYYIPSEEVINKPGFEYATSLGHFYEGEILDKEVTTSVFDGKCKLQWKADWAMRQLARNISFEMHGEDLRGSASVSLKIAELLNVSSPVFFPYGLFLDNEGKKISKSKGNGFSLDDAKNLLSVEAIKKFLANDPRRSRRFYSAMAPRLNDAVSLEEDISHAKLVNKLNAFSPLNKRSAELFLKGSQKFYNKISESKFDLCFAFYKKDVNSRSHGLNENEIAVFTHLARSLSLKSKFSEISTSEFLLLELSHFFRGVSRRQLYSFLYRGLLGCTNGPKLESWIKCHSESELLNSLENPYLSNEIELASFKNYSEMVSRINFNKKANDSMGAIILKENIKIELAKKVCLDLVKDLRKKSDEIVITLSGYQCQNVTLDEIERSCDLLENIDLNAEYFVRKIHGVTSFLPLNQPIYASICFGFVPSLMADDVCIRPPTAMHSHYAKLKQVIDFSHYNKSLKISYEDKEVFLSHRVNVTDAVIFTGTPENALKVRKHFRKNTLFILNGAGHNPLVVSDDADLNRALESSLRVVLYNQGQDCAGPNTILVHRKVYELFTLKLIESLEAMSNQVGRYDQENVIVGPNSDLEHSLKIAAIFRNYRDNCIYGGEINPVSGMIKPTVFSKPLAEGGNYKEFFAPVFFLQVYESDAELESYFLHPQYKNNAMYISLFGDSDYIKTGLNNDLHLPESILLNTDLHVEERGYLPYGGQGPAASCIWVNGERLAGSTLPQRDIFKHLVQPSLECV